MAQLVNSGDPLNIPASLWNEVVRMVQWWKGSRIDQLAEQIRRAYSPTVAWVQNNTSAAVSPFDVLQLGDICTDVRLYEGARYDSLHLVGVTPTTGYGKYAVLQEGCPAGGFARAVIHGGTLAKLTVTDDSDMACEIANGVSGSLVTGYVGTSRILLKNSGTGSKWGVIRVGDALDNFVGKPAGGIAANGGTGTVNVWSPDFSGVALGPTVTGCYNHSSIALTTVDKVAGCVINGTPIICKIA